MTFASSRCERVGCLEVAAGGNSLAAMIMQVMVAGDKTKEDS